MHVETIVGVVVRAALLCALAVGALPAQTAPKPAFIIGGEDGVASEIGAGFDAVILPAFLLVIENDAPFIKVFTHDGKLVQRIGRAGGGPGEFRAARSIAYDSVSRTAWVLDARLARVSRFSVGDTLRLLGQNTSLVTNMRNLCAMNGRVYALSVFKGALVHEIAIENDRVVSRRAFGAPTSSHPQSRAAAIQQMAATGPMVCDAPRNVVYTVAANLGELHRIDVATGNHTTVSVRDFVRPAISVDSIGARFGRAAGKPSEMILGVYGDIDGFGIVIMPGVGVDHENEPPLNSVKVSPTGAQSTRITHKWRPIGRVGANVVCAALDPAPTIAYFRLPKCP